MDNILILLSFVFLVRKMNSNEINDLTFKSDRLLATGRSGRQPGGLKVADVSPLVGLEELTDWQPMVNSGN